MVRIFVSTSHLSTLYMIMYARKTHKAGYKDVLIIDSPPKKESFIKLVKDTQNIYSWSAIIDLSTHLPDNSESSMSVRKKITRKIKDKPVIKELYSFLLKRHVKKKHECESKIISEKLKVLGNVIEINVLTQTTVNDTLFKLFPDATINYFEHGIGDYFFVQKATQKNFNFYCVFADTFKKLMESKGKDSSYVKKLTNLGDFPVLANEVIAADKDRVQIISSCKVEGKIALVLLESMHIFNVPDSYYTDYLDLCISQIPNPKEYTFVLKPHPIQTQKSIADSKKHLIEKYNLKTVVIDNNHFSVEVFYSLWKDATDYVFGTYSSALFYNSVLYKISHTKYYYSYKFLRPYTKKAPAQFMDIYTGIEEIIRDVFSANCIEMKK